MALILNNENLVLGRGEVYFDRYVNGTGEGERYIGNTPSFQITRTLTRKGRKTAYQGLLHDQPGKVVSEEITLRIVTDAISWENISEWFSRPSSNNAPVEGSEISPVTEQFLMKQGRWYQLGTQITPVGVNRIDRMTGIRVNGSLPFRLGIDWEVDLERGRFYIVPGSPRALNNKYANVTYFRRTSGMYLTENATEEVLGAIRYISRNPYGPRTDFYFPMARITPQGSMEMKGDEFQQMQFEATVMKRNPNIAMVYTSRFGEDVKAITADTTLTTADTNVTTADNNTWKAS